MKEQHEPQGSTAGMLYTDGWRAGRAGKPLPNDATGAYSKGWHDGERKLRVMQQINGYQQ